MKRDPHPSDISARRSFLGEDDIRFERERKRKRAPKGELPPIPDSPCCAQCANWWPPEERDDFGQCRVIVVEMDGSRSDRRVLTAEEARAMFALGVEPLRTRGFADGCSQFVAALDKEAA